MSLRDELRRLQREAKLSRIRCEKCGQTWVTREDVELLSIYAGWRGRIWA